MYSHILLYLNDIQLVAVYLDKCSCHTLSSAQRLPGNRRRHVGEAGRHNGAYVHVNRFHT